MIAVLGTLLLDGRVAGAQRDESRTTGAGGAGGCRPVPRVADTPALPDLLVAHKRGVEWLRWSPTTRAFNALGRTGNARPQGMAQLGSSIYIAWAESVARYDSGLREISRIQTGPVGALAASDGRLYIGLRGALTVTTGELQVLGTVTLTATDGSGIHKRVHDILVHEQRAYLLDNVVRPAYVFVVDVADPTSMTVIAQREFQGVWIELRRQWLSPEAGQWHIISAESSGYTGYSEHLVTLRASDGDHIGHRKIFGRGVETALRIGDGSALAPVWAGGVVDRCRYLVQVEVNEPDGVRYPVRIAIPSARKPRASGTREWWPRIVHDALGFLFVVSGFAIDVVRPEPDPHIVHRQVLDWPVGGLLALE